jgi:hypothetical protein
MNQDSAGTPVHRTLVAIVQLGFDEMRGIDPLIKDLDDTSACNLLRTTTAGWITNLASLITGAPATRHQIHTALVPDDSEEGADYEEGNSSGLQFRTSRMTGAPFVWNRLASRGIHSLAVNFPFRPANDDELVGEIPINFIAYQAHQKQVPHQDALIAFVRGTVAKNPGIQCVFATASFTSGKEDKGPDETNGNADLEDDLGSEVEEPDSVDEESTTDGPAAGESAAARKVIDFLSRLRVGAGADQMIAFLLGPRAGRIVLAGPRFDEMKRTPSMMNTLVPTLLDLFGEEPTADVAGSSLISRDPWQSRAAGASWSVDGGDCLEVDWSGLIRKALDGEASDAEMTVVRTHLKASVDCSLIGGQGEIALRDMRILNDLVAKPYSILRLAFILNAVGRPEDSKAEIQRLLDDHPDTQESRIAPLIGCWKLDPEVTKEILERHPHRSLKSHIQVGIWAKAAVRAGLADEAIDAIWSLIMVGRSLPYDRQLFAKLSMQRRASGDARRATIALRGLGNSSARNGGRDSKPDLLMLRAEALAESGSQPLAVQILESYLLNSPGHGKVSTLLERIRARG